MKKILVLALSVLMVLTMAACGGVEEADVIGIWRRETLYMAYYNCETDMIATFSEDGTFGVILVNHANNALLNMAGGDWTLEENRILAERGDGAGVMEFTYNTKKGTLEFEGYPLTKDK